jgi:PAS domain S-box-containing protein
MFEGFCVIDDTGRILMWSKQIQKICGIKNEIAIGKYAWEILEVPDGDLKSKLEKTLTGASPVNTFLSFQTPSGNIRQLKIPSRIVPFTDELGTVLGSIILVIDPSMLPLPKSDETLH